MVGEEQKEELSEELGRREESRAQSGEEKSKERAEAGEPCGQRGKKNSSAHVSHSGIHIPHLVTARERVQLASFRDT